jgi:hypothetical protein
MKIRITGAGLFGAHAADPEVLKQREPAPTTENSRL